MCLVAILASGALTFACFIGAMVAMMGFAP